MKYLTHQRIEEEFFKTPFPGAGASVFFCGTVRGNHQGHQVTHLIYEAYESFAERMIDDLIAKAFPIVF